MTRWYRTRCEAFRAQAVILKAVSFVGRFITHQRDARPMPDDHNTRKYRVSRRKWIATGSSAIVAGLAGCSGGGGGGTDGGNGGTKTTTTNKSGKKYADQLNVLMWPYYDLEVMNQPLRDEYGIEINAAHFNTNTEVLNKLRTGGAKEFDIIQGDSLWPRKYFKKGYIQPVDRSKLPNLKNIFPAFHPDTQKLHVMDGKYLGPPNAWGGYGLSYNPNKVPKSDIESFMTSIYDEKYAGHIATSSRMTMNIANTALALGYNDPKGNIWDVCSDQKLQKITDLLIKQKDWLITRYSDSRNLDRFYNNGELWVFPEFSDTYRRLALEGKDIKHNLRTKEGGMGWLEAWMMTSGVKSEAKKNAVHAFMNQRLSKDYHMKLAKEVGGAPTADVRDRLSDREIEIYFQDRTQEFNKLTQFAAPKCPSKWQQFWTKVKAT